MRKGFSANRKRMKTGKSFNPSQDYLNQAVSDFLSDGGKIKKKIEVEDEDLERFMAYDGSINLVDDSVMKR